MRLKKKTMFIHTNHPSITSFYIKSYFFAELAMRQHWSAILCAKGAWEGTPIGRVRLNKKVFIKKVLITIIDLNWCNIWMKLVIFWNLKFLSTFSEPRMLVILCPFHRDFNRWGRDLHVSTVPRSIHFASFSNKSVGFKGGAALLFILLNNSFYK